MATLPLKTFPKHPETGLKTISDPNDLRLFFTTTLTLQEYKEKELPELEYMYKDVLIKVKGNFVHPASIKKITVLYPNDTKTEISYNINTLTDDIKLFKLPKDAKDLAKIYNNLVTNVANQSKILDLSQNQVYAWLSLFCIYGEYFCASYDEYISSPDKTVDIITNIPEEIIQLKTREHIKPLNSTEIKATCHIILITMNKTFAANQADRDRQLVEYINRRKSAVFSSMGVPIGIFKIEDKFLTEISNIFKCLPQLRRMLFFVMYNQRNMYPELATAAILLYHSSMTTIKAIFDFIALEEKTKAHIEPKILEEIKHFIDITSKKQDSDGALWPYHRVLYPDDGTLNAANFPNLAVAAVHYFKEYGDPSFKFIVPPNFPVMPGLLTKIKIKESKELFTSKVEEVLSNDAIEGAKILGLDLKKLSGTKAAQEKAGVPTEAEGATLRYIMQELKDIVLARGAGPSKTAVEDDDD